MIMMFITTDSWTLAYVVVFIVVFLIGNYCFSCYVSFSCFSISFFSTFTWSSYFCSSSEVKLLILWLPLTSFQMAIAGNVSCFHPMTSLTVCLSQSRLLSCIMSGCIERISKLSAWKYLYYINFYGNFLTHN